MISTKDLLALFVKMKLINKFFLFIYYAVHELLHLHQIQFNRNMIRNPAEKYGQSDEPEAWVKEKPCESQLEHKASCCSAREGVTVFDRTPHPR